MKTERIQAIDTLLTDMETKLNEKGVTDKELEKYALYSTLGLLGMMEQKGYTVPEAIVKLTEVAQGMSKKGGSVRETRS